jgi:hypothetical protein
MKHTLCLGIAIWLTCSASLFAQDNASLSEQKRKAPSRSNAQEPTNASKAPVRDEGIYIVTDPKGVDFGPYLQSLLKTVKQNWYDLAPPMRVLRECCKVRCPSSLPSSRMAKLKGCDWYKAREMCHWIAPHGEPSAIRNFHPYLPNTPTPYIGLRFRFVYNPAKPSDMILQYRERSRP